MSGRSWFTTAQYTSQGLVYCHFSFLTNNTSDPAAANFQGCGGETGGASSAGGTVSNSGPSAVASITHSATGDHLVTLADGYRFVQAAHVSIDDASDALIARIGTISNEGAGNTTAVTFHIVTRAAATSTATDSTSRRISCSLVLKNSGSGT